MSLTSPTEKTAVVAAAAASVVAVAAGVLLLRRRRSSDSSSAASATKSAAHKRLEEFAASTADDAKVHFFTFPVLRQLAPTMTPYGVRVETFLRIRGIPYEKHITSDTTVSPNQLLPYVCYKGAVIADSQWIIEKLDDGTAELRNRESSATAAVDAVVANAVRKVCNFCLTPAVVRSLMYEDGTGRAVRYVLGSVAAAPLLTSDAISMRALAAALTALLRPVMRGVFGVVFGRTGFTLLSKAEYEEHFLRDLEAVETLLAAAPFIAGEEFGAADAALYSVLLLPVRLHRMEKSRLLRQRFGNRTEAALTAAEREALMDALYVNDTVQYLVESEVLNSYVDRITTRAFPDIEELLN